MKKKNTTDSVHILPRARRPEEIQDELRSLVCFRRALRKEDQEILDNLMNYTEPYIHQTHLAEHLTPFEYVLLTMLIEQRKDIKRLKLEVTKVDGSWIHPPFP